MFGLLSVVGGGGESKKYENKVKTNSQLSAQVYDFYNLWRCLFSDSAHRLIKREKSWKAHGAEKSSKC